MDMAARSHLRIGTSGWSYPSGRGTWNGVFYPPSRGRPRTFDELSFYAEHFNTVGTPVGHGYTAENRATGTAYRPACTGAPAREA